MDDTTYCDVEVKEEVPETNDVGQPDVVHLQPEGNKSAQSIPVHTIIDPDDIKQEDEEIVGSVLDSDLRNMKRKGVGEIVLYDYPGPASSKKTPQRSFTNPQKRQKIIGPELTAKENTQKILNPEMKLSGNVLSMVRRLKRTVVNNFQPSIATQTEDKFPTPLRGKTKEAKQNHDDLIIVDYQDSDSSTKTSTSETTSINLPQNQIMDTLGYLKSINPPEDTSNNSNSTITKTSLPIQASDNIITLPTETSLNSSTGQVLPKPITIQPSDLQTGDNQQSSVTTDKCVGDNLEANIVKITPYQKNSSNRKNVNPLPIRNIGGGAAAGKTIIMLNPVNENKGGQTYLIMPQDASTSSITENSLISKESKTTDVLTKTMINKNTTTQSITTVTPAIESPAQIRSIPVSNDSIAAPIKPGPKLLPKAAPKQIILPQNNQPLFFLQSNTPNQNVILRPWNSQVNTSVANDSSNMIIQTGNSAQQAITLPPMTQLINQQQILHQSPIVHPIQQLQTTQGINPTLTTLSSQITPIIQTAEMQKTPAVNVVKPLTGKPSLKDVKKTNTIDDLLNNIREPLGYLLSSSLKEKLRLAAVNEDDDYEASNEVKLLSLYFRFRYTKDIHLILSDILPIPPRDVSESLFNNITLKRGVSDLIIHILKLKVNTESDNKFCFLCIDDRSIKKRIIYNKDKDLIVGIDHSALVGKNRMADSVMCLMACGIKRNWKQVIGFSFTSKITKASYYEIQIKSAISSLEKAGFQVMGITTRQKTNLEKIFNKLGLKDDDHTITVNHKKYFVLIDPPSLIKSAKQYFENYQIQIPSYLHPAKWEDITSLEENQSSIGMMFDFSELYGENKFRAAHRLFSNTIVDLLERGAMEGIVDAASACSTASLCRQMNNAFDILNSSSNEKRAMLRQPIQVGTRSYEELKSLIKWFTNLEALNSGKKIKFVTGMIQSLKTVLNLTDALNTHKVSHISTSNLCMDSLDFFFHRCRPLLGSTNCREFHDFFTKNCWIDLLDTYDNSGNDSVLFPNIDEWATKASTIYKKSLPTKTFDINIDETLKILHTEPGESEDQLENLHTSSQIAGYLVSRLDSFHLKESGQTLNACNMCKKVLSSPEIKIPVYRTYKHYLKDDKENDGTSRFKYTSHKLIQLVMNWELSLTYFIKKYRHEQDFVKKVNEFILTFAEIPKLCEREFKEYIIGIFVKTRLHYILLDLNNKKVK